MTIKTRRKLFWLSVLIFLIIAPPIALYSSGWRLTYDFKIKMTGGLFVAVPESGASVYLNGKFIKSTNFLQSGVFVQNLTQGPYSVMISKDGHWPWTKNLAVAESEVAEARAFMLPQNINGTVLLKGQFESVYSSDKNPILLLEEKRGDIYTLTFYLPESNEFLAPANSASKKLLSSGAKLKTVSWRDNGADIFFGSKSVGVSIDLAKRSVSAKNSTLKLDETTEYLPHQISSDWRQKAQIRYDEKNIRINWLSLPLPYFLSSAEETVYQSKYSIRHASFFPKRSDVALVAVENGVFAFDLDGRSVKNFQPIYKGKSPVFAVLNNKIYVLDQEVLARMDL